MGDNEQAGAGRQHDGSGGHTTIGQVYEIRTIVWAHGIQAHPDELGARWALENYLPPLLARFPEVETVSRTEYINHRQHVIFRIVETTDKTEFKTWLETSGVHIVYEGHARYGRGPCFGRNGTADHSPRKSDDWEEGTSNSTGIFRLGYRYIGVSISELISYCYHLNLAKESDGDPGGPECHPEVSRRRYHPRRPEQIHRDLTTYLRNHTAGDRYWIYYKTEEDESSQHVIHHAGWRDTLSQPYELGELQDPADPDGTTMRCRVFCHFGCTTKVHNYPVVRHIAQWRRAGNERYAYWTDRPSGPGVSARWLFNLITFNERNDFDSWERSLDSTQHRTNSHLRRDHLHYQIY
jgi:hypothetical protein